MKFIPEQNKQAYSGLHFNSVDADRYLPIEATRASKMRVFQTQANIGYLCRFSLPIPGYVNIIHLSTAVFCDPGSRWFG